MAIKIIGNRGYYKHGGGISGVGAEQVGPIVGAITTITCDTAGEIQAFSVNQVVTGIFENGIVVQSSGGVSLRYSLSNPAIAASPDPDVRANAMWTTAQTVAANAIEPTDAPMFTAVEVTFTAPGELVFYAR